MSDSMIHMYGIPNCDTIRKARAWLNSHGVDYTFHNYKKEGVDMSMLAAVCDACGWEAVLNRRGTTWRKLSESEKQGVDREKALMLMQAYPSMIKRPILMYKGQMLVGFSPDDYGDLCS